MREWLPGVRSRAVRGRPRRAHGGRLRAGLRPRRLAGRDRRHRRSRGHAGHRARGARGARRRDVGVGPAEDGGYYLIALRAPHPELVRGHRLEHPRRAAADARACDGRRGWRVRQLEPLRDVDTLDDLRGEWPRLERRLSRPGPALCGRSGARSVFRGRISLPEVSMGGVRTYLEALMTLDEAPLKLEPGQVIFSAGEAGRRDVHRADRQRRPAHRRDRARDGRAGRHLRRAGARRSRTAQRHRGGRDPTARWSLVDAPPSPTWCAESPASPSR